ncbi:MAG: hypothetical protein DI532_20610 [Azospirillum brasilense]|nr:MAG: hypothetical protein DI532_20610 [Azospirillum brasilense]
MSVLAFATAVQTSVPDGITFPWDCGDTGSIPRLAHGAYHLPDHPVESWLADLAKACVRVPGAVICLGSAAFFDLLVTEPPARPQLLGGCHHDLGGSRQAFHRSAGECSAADLAIGVVDDVLCGIPVRRTCAARTLVDLVRSSRTPMEKATALGAGRRFADMHRDPAEPIRIAQQIGASASTIGRLQAVARLSRRTGS